MVSIEDILSGVHDHSFVASNQSYPFFWHTRDTIWLRLSMDNTLIDKNESHWLEVTDKLDSIDMYIIIGVTCFVRGDTIHSLLSRCDKALYQAKHHGGNRVEFLLDHTKPETKIEASLS